MDRRGSEVTDTCSHCLEEREGHRRGEPSRRPASFPWNGLGAPLYQLRSFGAGFFLQTDRVSFGERERGGGGGAGLSGGASHRGAPAGPRGPSSHQRSATSCRRSQALFKKYFPSGTPPASSGPHPRSRAEEHPASPAGLEETASLADSKPSRGQVDPNPPPPSGDP